MKLVLISGTGMASGLWLFDDSTPWRNLRGGSDYCGDEGAMGWDINRVRVMGHGKPHIVSRLSFILPCI